MITIDIPGFGKLQLTHLVMDYNGTAANDGRLLPGVVEALTLLAKKIEIHIITADTFGLAAAQLAELPIQLDIIPRDGQDAAKLAVVKRFKAKHVVTIGNGRNDRTMLQEAAVGIAVIHREGCSAEAIANADVICFDVLDALNLLRNPKRLVATLRS